MEWDIGRGEEYMTQELKVHIGLRLLENQIFLTIRMKVLISTLRQGDTH